MCVCVGSYRALLSACGGYSVCVCVCVGSYRILLSACGGYSVCVCVCGVIPGSTERVRGLHCLWPLQPLSSISWTCSRLSIVRSRELTAFIIWRARERLPSSSSSSGERDRHHHHHLEGERDYHHHQHHLERETVIIIIII